MAKKNNQRDKVYVPGTYVKVPDGLIVSKEFNKLKASSKSVYLLMLAYFDPFNPEEPFAFPYEDIRKITGHGRDTIKLAIAELVKDGYIKIPQRGRYPHNLSLYKIDMKPLEQKYPKVKRGKGTRPDYITDIKEGVE